MNEWMNESLWHSKTWRSQCSHQQTEKCLRTSCPFCSCRELNPGLTACRTAALPTELHERSIAGRLFRTKMALPQGEFRSSYFQKYENRILIALEELSYSLEELSYSFEELSYSVSAQITWNTKLICGKRENITFFHDFLWINIRTLANLHASERLISYI